MLEESFFAAVTLQSVSGCALDKIRRGRERLTWKTVPWTGSVGQLGIQRAGHQRSLEPDAFFWRESRPLASTAGSREGMFHASWTTHHDIWVVAGGLTCRC
jgi:hypothetical protein